MCTFQTLNFSERHGYILYCNQCHYIQFAFNCVLIHFHREDFKSFQRIVNDLAQDHEGMPNSEIKSILIPTPCEGLSLYLSLAELRALLNMVDEADSQLCANDLVSLFSAT